MDEKSCTEVAGDSNDVRSSVVYDKLRIEFGSTYAFVVDVVIGTAVEECVSLTGALVLHQLIICNFLFP